MVPKWVLGRSNKWGPRALRRPLWELVWVPGAPCGVLGELFGSSGGVFGSSWEWFWVNLGSLFGWFSCVFLDRERDELRSARFVDFRLLFVSFFAVAKNTVIVPTRENTMNFQLVHFIRFPGLVSTSLVCLCNYAIFFCWFCEKLNGFHQTFIKNNVFRVNFWK